jgi:2,3-bisphosphoglycerate-independent phosphoglycerate mutase
MPDHPTPVRTCGHSGKPVPFAIAGSGVSGHAASCFSEAKAEATGLRISEGHELMERFLAAE